MIQELSIQTQQRCQFKEITAEVRKLIKQTGISAGIAVLFVPHTTAAITINENADPDVQTDMVSGFDKLVPLHDNYRHAEGNSAAHIKSSLVGVSETLLIAAGEPVLGTWQGIYFCEFDGPRTRKLYLTIIAG
ncbi:secondary thiamine-phosphate synthase enzyme YjbQ [Pelobacter seleniigenes]|uniref:secondary thiamine-phosphate synthase enzyme YjbQ n=1 Tax=Pelobacter seleniigenes TaxID=407188 RepID=UPI0004A6AF84|nr:secondary thiamine-phosphate synthase enzyme YjbQ [Pelobacter seleniigenes]